MKVTFAILMFISQMALATEYTPEEVNQLQLCTKSQCFGTDGGADFRLMCKIQTPVFPHGITVVGPMPWVHCYCPCTLEYLSGAKTTYTSIAPKY